MGADWWRKRRARGDEHFFMLLKVTKDYLRLPEFDFLWEADGILKG
jgi:hypothetical protein